MNELLIPPALPTELEVLLAWQDAALCAQSDPETFFPKNRSSVREAKRICSGCGVKQECLEHALEKGENFGIWGGMNERDRRRLKLIPMAELAQKFEQARPQEAELERQDTTKMAAKIDTTQSQVGSIGLSKPTVTELVWLEIIALISERGGKMVGTASEIGRELNFISTAKTVKAMHELVRLEYISWQPNHRSNVLITLLPDGYAFLTSKMLAA